MSSKLGKHHQEYLEPDVKSLPTQNFFENNEVKINIQPDDSRSANQNIISQHPNQRRKEDVSTTSPNTSLEETATTKELNCAKKRFKSEELIYPISKCSIKTTKSLANVVSYSPNDQVPFKTTVIQDCNQLSIVDEHKRISSQKRSSSKNRKNSQKHQQTVRLEEPIPSTSTGITHNNPPDDFIKKVLTVSGTFLAKDHDDTTVGAVHCFQVTITLLFKMVNDVRLAAHLTLIILCLFRMKKVIG